MNCCSCLHARQAGNNDVVGCSYWTAIFHGNIDAMKTAFDFINKKENYNINLDSASIDREAIGFLIDVLIEDYAPKPLYEGWANSQQPYGQKNKLTDMTDAPWSLNHRVVVIFILSSIMIRKHREMSGR